MKGVFVDLSGRRFGLLRVRALAGGRAKDKTMLWICDCDCGATNIEKRADSLREGNTRSCGCLRRNNAIAQFQHYNAQRRASA